MLLELKVQKEWADEEVSCVKERLDSHLACEDVTKVGRSPF